MNAEKQDFLALMADRELSQPRSVSSGVRFMKKILGDLLMKISSLPHATALEDVYDENLWAKIKAIVRKIPKIGRFAISFIGNRCQSNTCANRKYCPARIYAHFNELLLRHLLWKYATISTITLDKPFLKQLQKEFDRLQKRYQKYKEQLVCDAAKYLGLIMMFHPSILAVEFCFFALKAVPVQSSTLYVVSFQDNSVDDTTTVLKRMNLESN